MARFLAFVLLVCVTVSPAAGERDNDKEVWLGEGLAASIGEHVQGVADKLGEKIGQLQATDNYKSIAEAVDGARESAAASLGHLQDQLTMSPEQQKAAYDAYKKSLAKLGDLVTGAKSNLAALRKAAEDAAPEAQAQLQEAIKNLEDKIEQLRSSEGYVKAANRLGEVRAEVQDSIADMQEKIDQATPETQAKLQSTFAALKEGVEDMKGQGAAAYQQSTEQAAAAKVAVQARIAELQTQFEEMAGNFELKQHAEQALQRLTSRFELLLATQGEVESFALKPRGVVDADPEAAAAPQKPEGVFRLGGGGLETDSCLVRIATGGPKRFDFAKEFMTELSRWQEKKGITLTFKTCERVCGSAWNILPFGDSVMLQNTEKTITGHQECLQYTKSTNWKPSIWHTSKSCLSTQGPDEKGLWNLVPVNGTATNQYRISPKTDPSMCAATASHDNAINWARGTEFHECGAHDDVWELLAPSDDKC